MKLFECARIEGLTERELKNKLYADCRNVIKMPEYIIARKSGLNMMQAELAALISQELKAKGKESFLMRYECIKEGYNSNYFHKKRPKKIKDEPEPKKKSKQ